MNIHYIQYYTHVYRGKGENNSHKVLFKARQQLNVTADIKERGKMPLASIISERYPVCSTVERQL